MPTQRQLDVFIARMKERHVPVKDIRAYILEQGWADPIEETGTVTTPQSQAAMIAGGGMPTAGAAPVEDVPAFSGAMSLLGESLTESIAGPISGLGELAGVFPEGTRQAIRDSFEEERQRFLASSPGAGRAITAGVIEFGTNLIPLAPGKGLGRAAGKVAGKLGVNNRLARGVAGALGAAPEGAIVGIGDRPLVDPDLRAEQSAIAIAGAAGLGFLGGTAARVGQRSDPGSVSDRFFRDHFSGAKPPKEGPRARMAAAMRKAEVEMRDDLAPVTRIGRAGGQERHATVLAQQMRSSHASATGPIVDATRNLDGKVTGESMLRILHDLDADARHAVRGESELTQDLNTFMGAQRNLELSRRGKGVTKSVLKKSNEALEYLSGKYGTTAAGTTKGLNRAAIRWRAWHKRAVLEPLREVGVFTDADITRMGESNEFYASFFRVTDDLAAKEIDLRRMEVTPVKGKRIAEGTDPKRPIKEIIGASAEQAARVQIWARRQRVRNLVADIADEVPEVRNEVRPLPEGVSPEGNSFRVFREGEVSRYQGPGALIEAAETLNPAQASVVINAAASLSRATTSLFRSVATLTLEFAAGNFGRDQFTFGVYTKGGGLPFITPAMGFVREMAGRVKSGRGGLLSRLVQPTQAWRDFLASGGAHSAMVSPDRWSLSREIKLARELATTPNASRLARQTKTNPLAPFQAISEAFEKPGRFAEFKSSRKAGKSIAESGSDAAEVTLNFFKAGRFARIWNAHEAFANAAIRDLDKFYTGMKTRPVTTLTRGFAYLTVPTALSYLKNKDDPDWQNLPEWEKVAFLHPLKVGNPDDASGFWIRLPKPPGVLNLLFSYLPQKAFEHFMNDDPDAAEEMVKALTDQTPLQYTPLAGTDALIDLAPNVVQPLVEAFANRQVFFDRPIVSERQKRLPPELQTDRGTSRLAEATGQATGQSPAIIDHLLRGYLPGLGRQGLKAADKVFGPDERNRGPLRIRDLPLVNRFTTDMPVGFGSQPVRDFYQLAEESEKTSAGLAMQDTRRRKLEYLVRHPEAQFSSEIREIRALLNGLANERHVLQDKKGITRSEFEDRMFAIDQQVTSIAAFQMEQLALAIQTELEKRLTELSQLQGDR